jgi:hypothetical protein
MFLPDFSTVIWGAPRLVAGAPRLVAGAPRLVIGAPRCSQVHLKASASVQSTLGFDHPGILVRQLSDTPRDSQRLPETPSDIITYCRWRWPATPAHQCTTLTQRGLSYQIFESRLNCILTKCMFGLPKLVSENRLCGPNSIERTPERENLLSSSS